MIKTENLSFKDLICYSDMEIEDGETTFICGESGSGKSTLLKLLNGTESPAGGRILYDGRPAKDMIDLRREISLCCQSVYLFDASVRENFKEFYFYRDLPCPNDETIEKYLSICLADFPLDSNCTLMSGGERQRIFSAIFLSFMPKVFMIDEPTSALDFVLADKFLSSVKSFCMKNKIMLIVVSHDNILRDKYADKIIYVNRKDQS